MGFHIRQYPHTFTMFCSLLFLLVTALYQYEAQHVDEECIQPPLIPNFDSQQIMGVWYPQLTSEDDQSKSCLVHKISSGGEEDGSFLLQRIYNQKVDNLKMTQVNNTSEFKIDWNGKQRSVWIVSTDYKTYGIMYICYLENPAASTLTITTRDPKPSDAVLKKAEDSLKVIKYDTIKPLMKPLKHDNCKQ